MGDKNERFTILKAARLVDGNGGPVAEQAAILLEGDTIKQIGTKETVQAPDGASAREIDYGDATILPDWSIATSTSSASATAAPATISSHCPTKSSPSKPLRTSENTSTPA